MLAENSNSHDLPYWLGYLESINPDHIDLGLDRVKKVIHAMGLDDFGDAKIIEIAGTNGKGSTAAMISCELEYNGILTGLYTSPHLVKFNERITIGGKAVSDSLLCEAFEAVFRGKGDTPLTYFEFTTIAALYCFKKAEVKVLVLEVGLGGRLDAVNALDADIAVIASVGMDHMAILGDTLSKIAYEKAGIIKSKSSVVVGKVDQEVREIIDRQIISLGAESAYYEGINFSVAPSEDGSTVEFINQDLGISYQKKRPLLPVCCLGAAMKVIGILMRRFGFEIKNAPNEGLVYAFLPGRMQLCRQNPDIYLDVAHNVPAAAHLKDVVESREKRGRRIAVVGMLKDKDIEGVLGLLSSVFDSWFVASLHTARGEDSGRLYSALTAGGVEKNKISAYDSVREALNSACNDAEKTDEIVVLGSFVTVAEASLALNVL
ncbi:MAG: bifunctional folylpolyglutamate synthase/dihydrofolate synthase [Succinivibrio sp.]|nr:bifunctional folylpolyglutamate synthase/dihydrofolate synthase [Succinivibrio sp.]